MSEEIFGAGFALACNILIDIGYPNFAKPDRHVKRILNGAGFIDAEASDYQALKAVNVICDAINVSTYSLDKVLFLTGSGRYFKHSHLAVASKHVRTETFLRFLHQRYSGDE